METLRARGNKTHCFPRGQSLTAVCYTCQVKTRKKLRRNRLFYSVWLPNLPRFQGAQPDHVWESSCCCFPRELVSIVHPRKVLTHETWRILLQSENVFELGGITIVVAAILNLNYNNDRLYFSLRSGLDKSFSSEDSYRPKVLYSLPENGSEYILSIALCVIAASTWLCLDLVGAWVCVRINLVWSLHLWRRRQRD